MWFTMMVLDAARRHRRAYPPDELPLWVYLLVMFVPGLVVLAILLISWWLS